LPDTFWGLTAAAWAAIGAIGTLILALATAFLVGVGVWQIRSLREEGQKDRTIAACDRYVNDPVLDATCHKLREARLSGELLAHPGQYYTYIRTLLNYLDSLAVGAAQGLYIENLMYDHLRPVVIAHVEQFLIGSLPGIFGLNPSNYAHLLRLYGDWSSVKPPPLRYEKVEHA
jgi:hypothetical protein